MQKAFARDWGERGQGKEVQFVSKTEFNNDGMNKKVKTERIQCADAGLAKGETSGFLLAVQPLETSLMHSIC